MTGTMKWEIVHVPGEPESSLEVSTVDVLASKIEPKLANKIVRQLNQVCPLENLRHVKRVRKRTVEGNAELSVILCLSDEYEKDAEAIPRGIHQLISDYNLCPYNAKVAKYAARSKEEWEEQCKLWPTSYHPSTNFDGVAGLSEGELQLIFNYMKVVIQLTKLSYTGGKVLNAAIIVDPISRQVIASANDQTCPWPTTYETSARYNCNDRCGVTIASHDSNLNGLQNSLEISVQKFQLDICSDVCAGVSCLNPWGWTAQKQSSQSSSMKSESKHTWHPLRHAALVAIENAAERDRQLFPGPGSSESQSTPNGNPLCADNCPAKRQKIQQHVCQLDLFRQEHSMVKEVPDNREPTEIMRPYLCTGFDIYLVWEPCTMCAMALVHQRIRRIFFALPNPNAGALGSVYRLQGEKSLNHHYSVFRILIPEQDLNRVELNVSDNFLLHG
ncbi:tRNA-specific adenosine deaminase TAD3 isoform X1 [Musa acuminata AAA Group]|uniref:CMP/dCMP-type deaminase domain-containing protein n=1 Tax=Musa acuminata subsp. malaccensis TaxID=214687 RepID=A0A804L5G1_MUSAM|nr:PREDICTED: probable inactive tRNA-specific adenosine deaminase-like protein 3 isoform X1 [Musa acuminata subsp. malaccensis]